MFPVPWVGGDVMIPGGHPGLWIRSLAQRETPTSIGESVLSSVSPQQPFSHTLPPEVTGKDKDIPLLPTRNSESEFLDFADSPRPFAGVAWHTWAILFFSCHFCMFFIWLPFSLFAAGLIHLFACFLWQGGSSLTTVFMSLSVWKGRCCDPAALSTLPETLSNTFRSLAYSRRFPIIHSSNSHCAPTVCPPTVGSRSWGTAENQSPALLEPLSKLRPSVSIKASFHIKACL